MSELEHVNPDNEREEMKHNLGPADGIVDEEMTLEKWKAMAEKMWNLLDDIDTASDMFHPPKNGFYKYTMAKAEIRFKLMGSDGYKLFPVKGE